MSKSSINVQPVKAGSENHNNRKVDLDYVRDELSHLNEYACSDSIAERLSLIKNIVKEKTGRTMQKKATPIREAVLLIKEHHTMEDMRKLAVKINDKFGLKTFQIYTHKDEGHYEDLTKAWKPNLHAHLVIDWTNHDTGKSIKMNRQDMSDLQTLVAEHLGMERGLNSSKKHIKSKEFKSLKLSEEIEEKKARIKKAEANLKIEDKPKSENVLSKAFSVVKSISKAQENEDALVLSKRLLKEANEKMQKLPTHESYDRLWTSYTNTKSSLSNLRAKYDKLEREMEEINARDREIFKGIKKADFQLVKVKSGEIILRKVVPEVKKEPVKAHKETLKEQVPAEIKPKIEKKVLSPVKPEVVKQKPKIRFRGM